MPTYLKYLITFILLTIAVFGGIFWKIDQKYKGKFDTQFSVFLSVDTPEAVRLYYRTAEDYFSEENFIERKIPGRQINQIVRFKIPTDASHFYLQVSKNPKQGKMVLKEFILRDKNRIQRFRGQELLKYFKPNKFITKTEVIDQEVVIQAQKVDRGYSPGFSEIAIENMLALKRKQQPNKQQQNKNKQQQNKNQKQLQNKNKQQQQNNKNQKNKNKQQQQNKNKQPKNKQQQQQKSPQ